MKRRSRRTRQRHLVAGAFFAVSGGLLVLAGIWTSAFYKLATRVIVVDDPPEASDFIYVLNGAYLERARTAARLYDAGVAPRVLLPNTREMAPATGRFPASTLSERIRAVIVEQGVPDSAVVIVPFPGGAVNTRDEALALRQHVEREPATRVIVVTTDSHTGRARRTVRRALRGLGVEVLMAAAPDESGLTPWNWWESEQGRKIYGEELLKQVAVVFGVSG